MIIIDYSPNGVRTKMRKFTDTQRVEAIAFLSYLRDKNYEETTLAFPQGRTPYLSLASMTYKVWGTL